MCWLCQHRDKFNCCLILLYASWHITSALFLFILDVENKKHMWVTSIHLSETSSTRRKVCNILEHGNQLLHSLGSISKVKCTANRFRASSESGTIWPVNSMINEKSGLILGLIDCVSRTLGYGVSCPLHC